MRAGRLPIGQRQRVESSRDAAPALAFCALGLYLLASWEIHPLFFSNQNTYFLQGLRLTGVEGLQSDWLSQTRTPHLAFTLLVAALQSLGVLGPGVMFLEAALHVGLLWAFWVLSGGHNNRRPVRTLPVRFLICAAFFILLTERGSWSVIFNWGGLADQYLFGGYLQPSEFGILILMAFALLSLERWRVAVGLLVLAATFHVSYVIPCGLLAALIAAQRAYEGQRHEALRLLALFGLGVAPAVAWGLSFGGEAATVVSARTLMAQEIIPQHAWPARWFSSDQLVKIVIMTLGSLLAWRRLSRAVGLAATGSLALIVFGTAYVYVSDNNYAGLLFPWRASVYLYPLSLFWLILAGVSAADWAGGLVRPGLMASVYKLAALALSLILLVESVRELTMQKAPLPQFPFAADVARQTTARDQIIIPPTDEDLWNRFRLLTLRPIYVDGKSHPYLAAEVLEWKRRVDAVNAFYRLPPADRRQQCREMGASFFVATSEEETFSLMACAP